MVELAEHFEGLTKIYHHPLIISESLYRSVKDNVSCRLLDWIPRADGGVMKIFTARRTLTQREKDGWGQHDLAMTAYFDRDFTTATERFRDVQKTMPADELAPLFLERCARLAKNPPPAGWNGVDLPEAS